uniref:Protein kinase domain-containing protein n=1 Tax=Aegilops tauschii subsp. strangulata TaxID=200361 RepID=A0A453J2I1_AEGTS
LSTEPSPPPPSRSVLIGVSSSISLLIIIGSLICFILWRRRKQAEIHEEAMEHGSEEGNLFDVDQAMEDDFEKGSGPKRFRYKDLVVATGNFCDENKLGQGGFGSVYRGFLNELNLQVAIKRVSKGSKQGRKEYASEVRVISRLRHKNLVQLIGWCHEGGNLLLVYELMPNGSLDGHLYGANNVVLPWSVRTRDFARIRLGASLPTPGLGPMRPAQGHQAKQHHARRVVQGQARRLRARQARPARPKITDDRFRRHDGVHGPGVHDHRQDQSRVRCV